MAKYYIDGQEVSRTRIDIDTLKLFGYDVTEGAGGKTPFYAAKHGEGENIYYQVLHQDLSNYTQGEIIEMYMAQRGYWEALSGDGHDRFPSNNRYERAGEYYFSWNDPMRIGVDFDFKHGQSLTLPQDIIDALNKFENSKAKTTTKIPMTEALELQLWNEYGSVGVAVKYGFNAGYYSLEQLGFSNLEISATSGKIRKKAGTKDQGPNTTLINSACTEVVRMLAWKWVDAMGIKMHNFSVDVSNNTMKTHNFTKFYDYFDGKIREQLEHNEPLLSFWFAGVCYTYESRDEYHQQLDKFLPIIIEKFYKPTS